VEWNKSTFLTWVFLSMSNKKIKYYLPAYSRPAHLKFKFEHADVNEKMFKDHIFGQ
jgi:hypothetical protein